jgi:prepilin-type N-terminal cleavage/methylation domain-containing protein
MMKKNRGFTLIELLVVVSIIGFLSSVVLGSLQSARGKGETAKTTTEMKSLQNALELYKNDRGSYPGQLTLLSNGNYTGGEWVDDYDGYSYIDTALQELVTGRYISKIPHSPRYPNNYCADDGSCFYYLGYMTYPASYTYNAWSIAYTCGRKPVENYMIYFYSNNQKLKLPRAEYTYDYTTYYDYQTGNDDQSYAGTYCLSN